MTEPAIHNSHGILYYSNIHGWLLNYSVMTIMLNAFEGFTVRIRFTVLKRIKTCSCKLYVDPMYVTLAGVTSQTVFVIPTHATTTAQHESETYH